MKTFSAKANEVLRKWYIIDAKGRSLGRVAVTAANILVAKGRRFLHRMLIQAISWL